ncbi:F28K20.11 [Arabidopsis thaliana]|uniref:F28K20.11 n=1 Tax=Arabidopsis thaliana TaxID=3702 RepID=Q9SA11_ARATH|nr:F28K20.11 [Arabidopsis thaliana]
MACKKNKSRSKMHRQLVSVEIWNNLDEEEDMTIPMDDDMENCGKRRVERDQISGALEASYCEGEGCHKKHTYLALVKLMRRRGFIFTSFLVFLIYEGTNLKLDLLKRFNNDMHCLCSFYITLLAFDPTSRLQETFQVKVE